MGDVKLAGLIGLVLGSIALSRVAVAAGAAILLGGVGAIAALAMGRGRKSALAVRAVSRGRRGDLGLLGRPDRGRLHQPHDLTRSRPEPTDAARDPGCGLERLPSESVFAPELALSPRA